MIAARQVTEYSLPRMTSGSVLAAIAISVLSGTIMILCEVRICNKCFGQIHSCIYIIIIEPKNMHIRIIYSGNPLKGQPYNKHTSVIKTKFHSPMLFSLEGQVK